MRLRDWNVWFVLAVLTTVNGCDCGSDPGNRCGDGVIAGAEQCDDGNLIGGDGCSETCGLEQGACGDGVVDQGEECDDGAANGDALVQGCSAQCVQVVVARPPFFPAFDGVGVLLHSGELEYQLPLLVIDTPVGPELDATLWYRSGLRTPSAFGTGWSFNHGEKIVATEGGFLRHLYDGSRTEYVDIGGDVFAAKGRLDQLTVDGTELVIEDVQGFVHVFAQSGEEWLLDRITDATGQTLRVTWQGGVPIRLTDARGRTLTLRYDAGVLVEVEDHTGRTVELAHAGGNLVSFTQPDGGRFLFDYDVRMTSLTSPEGGELAIEYDAVGRVSRQTLPDGGQFSFEYTATGTVTVLDPVLAEWVYELSADGQVTSRTIFEPEAQGGGQVSVNRWTYNDDGFWTTHTRPGDDVIQRAFPASPPPLARGNVLAVTHVGSDGTSMETTDYTYTSFNQIKSLTNPEGETTTYVYDYEEATLGDVNADGRTNQTGRKPVAQIDDEILDGDGVPFSPTWRWRYGDDGLMLREEDPDGVVRAWTHDAAGYWLTTTIDPGGLDLTETRTVDPLGRVTAHTDADGFTRAFTLDAMGRPIAEITATGARIEWDRDLLGNVTEERVENRDANGDQDPANPIITRRTTYDPMSRPTTEQREVAEGVFDTWTYAHDALGQLVRVVEPGGLPVLMTYDAQREHVSLTRGEGAGALTETIVRDAAGLERSRTDPMGVTTEIAYDPFQRPLTTIYADGAVSVAELGFDRRVRREQLFDVDGTTLLEQTDRTFNAQGRPIRIDRLALTSSGAPIGDGVQTVEQLWSGGGRLLRMTEEGGTTTSYAYDAAGRRTGATFSDGSGWNVSLDGRGNATRFEEVAFNPVTGAVETHAQATTWNSFAKPAAVIHDADGAQLLEDNRYDSRGNLIERVDTAGDVTRWSYDGRDRAIARVEDADGVAATDLIEYDGAGDLVARVDANGNRTEWSYDVFHRPVGRTLPDGNVRSWTWNPSSTMASFTNENGVTFSYAYDARHRLVGKQASELMTQLAYNGRGDLVSAVSGRSVLPLVTHTFAVDTLRRVDAWDQTIESIVQAASRTFDERGNVVSMTYPSGLVVEMSYDANSRVTAYDTNPALLSAPLVQHDYEGPIAVRRRYGNGVVGIRELFGDLDVVMDGVGRVSAMTYQLGAGPVVLGVRTTMANNMLTATRAEANPVGGLPAAAESLTFTYDGQRHLTGYTRAIHETFPPPPADPGLAFEQAGYELDVVGNRLSSTTTLFGEPFTRSYTIDEMNRIVAVDDGGGPQAMTYDANGNRTSDADGDSHVWTQDDRLLLTADDSGNVLVNLYDAFGRRVAVGYPDGTTELHFWRDTTLIETVRDDGTNLRSYIVHREQGRPEPLVLIAGGQPFFLHSDPNGAMIGMTDQAGVVVERYTYDGPYGGRNTFVRQLDGTFLPVTTVDGGSPWGLSGMYVIEPFDDYVLNRWYDPTEGVFLSTDICEGVCETCSEDTTAMVAGLVAEATGSAWCDDANGGDGDAYAGGAPASATDPCGTITALQAASIASIVYAFLSNTYQNSVARNSQKTSGAWGELDMSIVDGFSFNGTPGGCSENKNRCPEGSDRKWFLEYNWHQAFGLYHSARARVWVSWSWGAGALSGSTDSNDSFVDSSRVSIVATGITGTTSTKSHPCECKQTIPCSNLSVTVTTSFDQPWPIPNTIRNINGRISVCADGTSQ